MPAAFFSLAEAAEQPLERVGGKARALGQLIRFGAPVPPGLVVPPDTDLPSAGPAISAAARQLQGQFVAVRSSAAGEDAADKSWAGQFESYLYVAPADVPARVADCRASGRSERARAYDSARADMPVAAVVQAMIPADVAGVLFTANPVTHSRDEIMIEAVYGLGEQLVQGMATPDNYIVDKSTGRATSQQVAAKTTKLVGSSAGIREQTVPAAHQSEPALSAPQLAELTQLATTLESKFGHPLDIEFAYAKGKLYILQARPITTLR